MPSKFKKALGAVKDHTSIGLAKVSKTATGSSAAQLDLLVLKATTHDDEPIDERHVSEIFTLTITSPANASACVQSLSRRIERTHSWVVAVKCLHLVLRGIRDGGTNFPREAISAVRRGAHLLDLTTFRDESVGTNPWDYTAFVRTYAIYIGRRLDCIIRGKLPYDRSVVSMNRLCDMKPPAIIDRISHWQSLLDRAIATRPTGPARRNTLVQVSFYLVVRESFELYKDISDGLALILDSFFQLQRRTCTSVYQMCVRAAKQFEELTEFYEVCRAIGVGRRSEYPEVQKISDKLLDTLNEFIKSSEDNPSSSSSSSPSLIPTTQKVKATLRMFGPLTSLAQSRERLSALANTRGEICTLSDLVDFSNEMEEHNDSPSRFSDTHDLDELPKREADPRNSPTSNSSSKPCKQITRTEQVIRGADEWELVFARNRAKLGMGDASGVSSTEQKNSFAGEAATAPTFCVGKADAEIATSDPLSLPHEAVPATDETARRRMMQQEQQMWLQQQNKIMASRNLAP